MLDRAFLQMIKHLIADNARSAGNLPCLFKIRYVEVAHTIGAYFALLTERVERRKRVLQRMRSAPVQQVAIQPVGLEVAERSLASDLRPQPGGILLQHLGDQKYLIAPAHDGVADEFLGGAGAIHLRGVDVIHSEINASSQGGDRGGSVAFLDVPRALADDADLARQRTELPLLNGGPRTVPGITRHDVARVR